MFRDQKTLYYIGLFTIFVIIFNLIDNIAYVSYTIGILLKVLTPVIFAFLIAYLLRPAIDSIEKRFKAHRIVSISIVYLLFLGFMTLSTIYITPRVLESVTKLISTLPRFTRDLNLWITNFINESDWFNNEDVANQARDYLTLVSNEVSLYFSKLLNNLVFILLSLTSTLLNLLIGMIISIYMLFDKEKLGIRTGKLVQAVFPKERAFKIIRFFKDLDQIFSRYFAGIIFDSLIIGVLALAGLLILKTPFTLLSSIVVGVTNVIPYFGPLVGIVFTGIIVSFVSPIQALWAAIFLFILQQFDGYYLKPKILGEQVGISPLWIIIAIVVGGGTFGIFGMFIAVPIFAAFKAIVDTFVDRRLAEKGFESK